MYNYTDILDIVSPAEGRYIYTVDAMSNMSRDEALFRGS